MSKMSDHVCEAPGCRATAQGFVVFEAVVKPTREHPFSHSILPFQYRCPEHVRKLGLRPEDFKRVRLDFEKRLGQSIDNIVAGPSNLTDQEVAELRQEAGYASAVQGTILDLPVSRVPFPTP